MPEIQGLTAADIARVLPPDEPDLAPAAVGEAVVQRIAYFDAELVRIGQVAELLDAWGRRIDRVPLPPPQPATLHDLVTAARNALRRRRLTLDRTVLTRRADVLTALRTEVAR
jgi:hypothetical protein